MHVVSPVMEMDSFTQCLLSTSQVPGTRRPSQSRARITAGPQAHPAALACAPLLSVFMHPSIALRILAIWKKDEPFSLLARNHLLPEDSYFISPGCYNSIPEAR